jgi:hypothetical protein
METIGINCQLTTPLYEKQALVCLGTDVYMLLLT